MDIFCVEQWRYENRKTSLRGFFFNTSETKHFTGATNRNVEKFTFSFQYRRRSRGQKKQRNSTGETGRISFHRRSINSCCENSKKTTSVHFVSCQSCIIFRNQIHFNGI